MSREQAYFPPNGTKYEWGPKALAYSTWNCRPWDPHASSQPWDHPIAIARVDLVDGKFKWWVEIRDWHGKRRIRKGGASTALKACLKAEAVCDEERAKLWEPWMAEAVKAGWRPPAWT